MLSQLQAVRRFILRWILPEFVWPETVSIDGVIILVLQDKMIAMPDNFVSADSAL